MSTNDGLALRVHDRHFEGRVDLALRLDLGAELVNLRSRQMEARLDPDAAGPEEVDRGALVPERTRPRAASSAWVAARRRVKTTPQASKKTLRWIGTAICAASGTAFLVAAKSMDYPWFERHVLLPGYYPWSPPWVYRDVRAGVAIAGIALIAAAWPLGRKVARATLGGAARIALAVVLALAASELILRRGNGQLTAWRAAKLELRLVDPIPDSVGSCCRRGRR